MMNRLIRLTQVGLSYDTQTCFENFTTSIHPGSRIAIIGPNGAGKSSLLKMLEGTVPCSEGEIDIPAGISCGYVPQLIDQLDQLSGGGRLMAYFNQVLAQSPDVLLLDEPTNHLDIHNRQILIRAIDRFPGTVVMASHDTALIEACSHTIWHLEDKQVRIFTGSYAHYLQALQAKREALEIELHGLKKAEKDVHVTLMREQIRAKHSRQRGEKSIDQHKWPTIVSKAKARRGEETSAYKRKDLREERQRTQGQLQELKLPAIIIPTFSITAAERSNKSIVSISQGALGYDAPVLEQIYFDIASHERIGLIGNNGVGKSTFIQGILQSETIQVQKGVWLVPRKEHIGYMDQHYATLDPSKTVLETLRVSLPHAKDADIRQLLATFLFYSDQVVETPVAQLSGGEKARLCLAQIAAKTPPLLILDEVTNNLDLLTLTHTAQVLSAYPGAIIAISHDVDFLQSIGITELLDVSQWSVRLRLQQSASGYLTC